MDHLSYPAGAVYLHYLAYLSMQPLAALSPSAPVGESFISPLPTQLLNALSQQLIGRLPITLSATYFSVDSFNTSDFARYGIPLPDHFGKAVAKRKAEYLAARLCAKTALQRHRVASLPWMLPEERCPCWPEGWLGSLTHSDGIAAAAIARGTELNAVGIDIEGWIAAQRAERLAPAILREEELAYWHSIESPESRGQWLTRIFSAKESLYKALYPLVRKPFYFHDASVIYDEARPERFKMRLEIDLSDELSRGFICSARSLSLHEMAVTLIALPAEDSR
ncbi:4'-phosphopantetheinyl transferase family protein [Carnimonas bestiolae]|uniref:4'-phosphopantetheinyl transferase family protein n=1 Tax=Carnimonas bestiolae TaxID=3402172 RepID=UPI003F4A9D58